LETLEERMAPVEERPVLDVVLIDGETKKPTGRLHLKLGYTLSPEHPRIRSRTRFR
jgi:hypothetical protein